MSLVFALSTKHGKNGDLFTAYNPVMDMKVLGFVENATASK